LHSGVTSRQSAMKIEVQWKGAVYVEDEGK
jgi:hypothetical protein